MKWLFQIMGGMSFLALASGWAADSGGLNARFEPDDGIYPGDLVTLLVEMDRADYGQFALKVPPHPRFHLVSREKIAPRLEEGRYLQGERLVLQALSSGPLTVTGIRAELTEATGKRTVELPALTLQVLPFAAEDMEDTPLPLPLLNEKMRTGIAGSWVILLLLGIIAFLVTHILRNPLRLRLDQTENTSPVQITAKKR